MKRVVFYLLGVIGLCCGAVIVDPAATGFKLSIGVFIMEIGCVLIYKAIFKKE